MNNSTITKNMMFIDIETASGLSTLDMTNKKLVELWMRKADKLKSSDDETPRATYEKKAALLPEFGKIICVSVCIVANSEYKTKSFSLREFESEKTLLQAVSDFLTKNKDYSLCAHNGKAFDFPYLAKRMIINNVSVPSQLDSKGKKPWEITNKDTMELWQMGDFKSFTSLDLLCYVLGVDSPKDNGMSGDQVSGFYWNSGDMKVIEEYCEGDAVALAKCYIKMNGGEV